MAAVQVQWRKGTTAENDALTGAVAEITVDTDEDSLRVHDGATAGGHKVWNSKVVNGATSKATPVDADQLPLIDSAASNVLKKLTWANLKTTLGSTFAALAGSVSQAFSAASIELGHASDTTLTRVSAGVIAVESNTVAMLGTNQTFTAPQKGTRTTDNDASFDLSVTNLWKCTPTGAAALTFTNHADGMSGNILFVNGSNYAITAAATTKVTSTFLATISVTGTYIIHFTDDGTNTYCSTAGAMA